MILTIDENEFEIDDLLRHPGYINDSGIIHHHPVLFSRNFEKLNYFEEWYVSIHSSNSNIFGKHYKRNGTLSINNQIINLTGCFITHPEEAMIYSLKYNRALYIDYVFGNTFFDISTIIDEPLYRTEYYED